MASSVIFLDIDGVLCTARSHVASTKRQMMRHLDHVGAKMVERLLNEFDAQLVLSSTWRTQFDKHAMTVILLNGGFSDVPWHQCWKTPENFGGARGLEIKQWHEANQGVTNYLILDDDQDFLSEQEPHLVRTCTYDGFGYKDWEKARKILKGTP